MVLAFALEAGPSGAAHVHVSMRLAQQLPARRGRPVTTRHMRVSGFQVSISTMQQATIQGAASTQGHACPDGWRGKETSCSWRRLPGSWCLCFHPTGFGDTWGDECFSSRHTGLPRVCSGSTFGDPPADSTCHLFQKCAISLWEGNAALWIHRISSLAPSMDGVISSLLVVVYLSFCVLFIYLFTYLFIFCSVLCHLRSFLLSVSM